VDEYVELMRSLKLPTPKMMDVALRANRHVGAQPQVIARPS
jgi:sulfur dioxygenase